MDMIQFIFLGILFTLIGVYFGISIVNYYKLKELKDLMTKAFDMSTTIEEVNEFKEYSESSLYDAWKSNLISVTTYCKLMYHIGSLYYKKNAIFNKD